ncbi:AcrR family transcriptional regulator [Amycolatopsis bartoniae]|uniref:TetR family transcriptional regulator n=1 Tax=Amycolatopsis bartoniae TaxID=941986 RepID=A0A8H9J0G6_9PSEU|nr:TetR/AcrR family transcriptional regulator [Amycolatopsis bartoniae]MBB2933968.1 AcrR family transcriptional regulator [Amycolatopsis bartoniae]TVT02806.1 TetR/AcrR family transcriptional regulator [Amycolatopsis bartoniae]GHF86246.1 TetR family transcriptional regulator [Amycolatopsis bartoniae]
MPTDPRQRRAARHAPSPAASPSAAPRKTPITVERITDAALQVIATEGYDALTIRRVAAVLGTGPSSLYAHIVNKEDLDDLIVGRLCAAIQLPEPDPASWREQILDVYAQLRDQYLKYPGVSRAALAMVPTHLETLRVSEGILAILLAGGIEPQTAAWALDALTLYVNAYALERSLVQQRQSHHDDNWVLSREELVDRFTALPADRFPHTRRHAAELTSGSGHERFDFTITLIIDRLAPRPSATITPSTSA